ncbi:MAG: methyltransferase type 11, partial [Deltaproteobacteria bacterium]|nr:methyltransferase type 11 [Deltaproteobacteria bacterium]
MSFHATHGTGELLARYSFVEPLLAGRRVLELGGAARSGGETALSIAERGAAAVLSIDDDPAVVDAARRDHAHPFVEFRAARVQDLPRRSFDVVLLADGAPLATDPELVAALSDLLSPRGYLVAALAVPGATGLATLAGDPGPGPQPGYEAFVGALSARFPSVEVATQAAAVGWVLAMSGAEDPDLAIDGAAAGVPEAAAYLAVCGPAPSRLDGMVLVTLPHRTLADRARAAQEAARAHAGCAAREAELRATAGRTEELARALARAEEEVARLAADLEAARGRADEAERAADGNRGELAAALAAVERMRAAEADRGRDLDTARSLLAEKSALAEEKKQHIGSLEARIAELDAMVRSEAAEAEISRNELHQLRADAEAARREAGELSGLAEDLRARAEAARFEAEAAKSGLTAARREADEARAEAESARGTGEAARAEAAAARDEARAAMEEADRARTEQSRLQGLAEAAAAERDAARAELEALRSQAGDAGARAQAAREEAAGARAEAERVVAEREEALRAAVAGA